MTFIIEHPTRGGLRPDSVPGLGEWHWSWSSARNDADKTWQFATLEEAIKVFKQLPERLQLTSGIMTYMNPAPGMRFPDYVKVYPKEG